jgi:hypothetical protein
MSLTDKQFEILKNLRKKDGNLDTYINNQPEIDNLEERSYVRIGSNCVKITSHGKFMYKQIRIARSFESKSLLDKIKGYFYEWTML